MATLHQMVIVGRVVRGLLAGRDGEEVIADVRDCARTDPTSILKKVVFVAVLAVVALGCVEAAVNANSPLLADFNAIRMVVGL